MTTYTLKELRKSETKLRQAAGEVLDPGPWKHQEGLYALDGACVKCGLLHCGIDQISCSIPDPAEGPLEIVAEKLIRKAKHLSAPILESAIADFLFASTGTRQPLRTLWIQYVLDFRPAERIICCLLALGKVKP